MQGVNVDYGYGFGGGGWDPRALSKANNTGFGGSWGNAVGALPSTAPAFNSKSLLQTAIVIAGLAWLFKDSKVAKDVRTGALSITKKSSVKRSAAGGAPARSVRPSKSSLDAILAIDPKVSRSVRASKRSVSKLRPVSGAVSKVGQVVGL